MRQFLLLLALAAEAASLVAVSVRHELVTDAGPAPFELTEITARRAGPAPDEGDGAAAAARNDDAWALDVVLLPGNPGLPAFYEDFGRALVARLAAETAARGAREEDAAVRLTTLGYLGHGEHASVGAAGVFTIDDNCPLATFLFHLLMTLRSFKAPLL